MLLWEQLATTSTSTDDQPKAKSAPELARTRRLPYDRRCSARTRSGARCRGKIYGESEFCFFHDPELARRRAEGRKASKQDPKRRRLTHLPDGYLRKLNSLSAVGSAMDRLYREVRLGIITPEMGRVLFGILARLQDTGLVTTGTRPERSKASRLRPRMKDLLTRKEQTAWKQAVENAISRNGRDARPKPRVQPEPAQAKPDHHPAGDTAFRLKLQSAG